MANKNRRQFVTLLGAGTVAIPLGLVVTSLPSKADDLPMLDPEDEKAKTYAYVAQAEGEANCAGCLLYIGDAEAESAPCGLFPGKHVAGAGWCSAFAAKPS